MRLQSIRFGFAAMCCVTLLSSCEETGCDICPFPPGNLSGAVTMNGVPLAGVQLLLSGSATDAAETGANGLYALDAPHYGLYQVTPQLAGHAFRPASRVVEVTGAASIDLNFTAETGTVHTISGNVTGSGPVVLTLSGDNTGQVIAGVGGAFTIPNLRLGSYVVTPSASGKTFTPAADTVDGVMDFNHKMSGGLGTSTLTSVTSGMNDRVACFAYFPLNPPEGIGSIRPKRVDEDFFGQAAVCAAMWTAQETILVTYTHNAFSQSMTIQLGPNRTWVLTGDPWELSERMVGGSTLAFTATP